MKTKEGHTPEPWALYKQNKKSKFFQIIGNKSSDGWTVVTLSDFPLQNPADAERVVACVNACQGLSNEVLNSGFVTQAKIAVELIDAHLDDIADSNPGYLSKLCLQDFSLMNRAYIAVSNALKALKAI